MAALGLVPSFTSFASSAASVHAIRFTAPPQVHRLRCSDRLTRLAKRLLRVSLPAAPKMVREGQVEMKRSARVHSYLAGGRLARQLLTSEHRHLTLKGFLEEQHRRHYCKRAAMSRLLSMQDKLKLRKECFKAPPVKVRRISTAGDDLEYRQWKAGEYKLENKYKRELAVRSRRLSV